MSDVFCAKCGEPWDYYGLKHGDVEKDEADKILKGLGCPACGFGSRCTHCEGTGKEQMSPSKCNDCRGHMKVLVRRCRGDLKYAGAWISGYESCGEGIKVWNRVVVLKNMLYKLKPYECAEGMVEQAFIRCPECWPKAENCRRCNGTGEFAVNKDSEAMAMQSLESICDATDEDPIKYIHNFRG